MTQSTPCKTQSLGEEPGPNNPRKSGDGGQPGPSERFLRELERAARGFAAQREQKDAGKTPAELWEEQRLAHWKLMRAAWERWQELRQDHEAQGFNASNPFE